MGVDISELEKLQADLQKIADRFKNNEVLLDRAGKYMVNTEVPKVFREQGPGWTATRRGGKILQDTGALAASVVYSVEGNTLIVGTHLPYAAPHQYGGTITPTKGKFLAIPDSSLSKTEQKNFDLRSYTKTWVKPSGNGYTVFQRGARDQVMVIAHLVPSVDIPQRQFLSFSERAFKGIATVWNKLIWEGKE